MSDSVRQTCLHERHLAAGARMVPFAGWEMPVQYTAGLIAEHHAVRRGVGLFDVSHMGEFHIHGSGAADFLQRLTPNNIAKLKPGRAHYSALLTEEGTYIDDLLIYHQGEDDFLVVVNAANAARDIAWLHGQNPPCTVEDVSDHYALLALQGPKAPEVLTPLVSGVDPTGLRYYRHAPGEVAGQPALISRTGYTGEDGFELYLAPDVAPAVWDALIEAGRPHDLQPAGLGARDTLRLEAGMALYGHEIDDQTTPWEAALDWTVKLDQGDFVGRDALLRQREAGVPRRLVGLEIRGRGIAREGHEIHHDGAVVATVASGTYSPTLEKAIATALLPVALATTGQRLEIAVRKRRLEAEVVDLPFYRRPRT